MATKDVLDKKSLEKYRKQIREDFEENYKDELVKEITDKVSSEVKDNFNNSFKEELVNELSTEVKEVVRDDLVREERRVYRHKSFKIFRLSVYILVLIAIIVYVAYRLYVTDNVDLIKYNYVPQEKEVTNNKKEETTTPKEEEKIDYFNKYRDLINDIKVYDYSLYKGTVKVSDMSMINRLQTAYSTLTDADIEQDGSIYIIKSSTMKNAYVKLFGVDNYEPTSFNVYNINFIYSPNKNEYIAIVDQPNTEDVIYEAFDADEDDNYILVRAYAAKISNNKVYNVVSGKELGAYSNSLENYKNKLTVVTFRFTKDKNFYSLSVE